MFKSKISKIVVLLLIIILITIENLVLIFFYQIGKNQKSFKYELEHNQGLIAKCETVQASSTIITVFKLMNNYNPSSMFFPDGNLHVNYGRELSPNSNSWTEYAGVGTEFIFDNNGVLIEKICK